MKSSHGQRHTPMMFAYTPCVVPSVNVTTFICPCDRSLSTFSTLADQYGLSSPFQGTSIELLDSRFPRLRATLGRSAAGYLACSPCEFCDIFANSRHKLIHAQLQNFDVTIFWTWHATRSWIWISTAHCQARQCLLTFKSA